MKKDTSHPSELYHGSIVRKILIFAIPLMLTGLLQLLYNAADMIVVGRFAGKEALSAVGATSSVINLFLNVFTGLSLGASVVTSRCFGSNDYKGVSETVHTSIALSIFAGIFLTIFGWIFARPMLNFMDTPADVMDGAILYMKIFFGGMTFNMVYTYGSALLRSVGDTKRPLIFLTLSGIVNVVLNLIFVIIFHMGVAGVGFATIISQAVSMVLVINCLIKSDSIVKLTPKEIAFHKDKLIMLIKVGLPAGIQGCFFSISNVLIQSSVNFFGTVVVAGNTAASNIEGLLYVSVNALTQANITFVSQNIGAKQYARVRRGFACCIAIALISNLFIVVAFVIFSVPLVSLYSSEADVIAVGAMRLSFMSIFQFLCVLMHLGGSQMQAIGRSFLSMIITLFGVCIVRIGWVYTIFQMYKTIETVYWSYPFTWGLTAVIQMVCVFFFMKSIPKTNEPLPSA